MHAFRPFCKNANHFPLLRHRHPDVLDGHPPPHFHASYQGFEVFVRIEDGEVMRGSLPRKAARIVRQWALDHRAELMANWQRGVDLLPLELIAGADLDD